MLAIMLHINSIVWCQLVLTVPSQIMQPIHVSPVVLISCDQWDVNFCTITVRNIVTERSDLVDVNPTQHQSNIACIAPISFPLVMLST